MATPKKQKAPAPAEVEKTEDETVEAPVEAEQTEGEATAPAEVDLPKVEGARVTRGSHPGTVKVSR